MNCCPFTPAAVAKACNPAYQLRRRLANKKNADGETRLVRAVRYGELAAVKAQLDAGADPNLPLHDGMSMLHRAVLNRDTGILQALAGASGIDPNVTDRDGKTALLLAVERGQTDMVRALLRSAGLDVNKPDVKRDSPLNCAARKGDVLMALLILTHPDTDPNGANSAFFRSGRVRDHFRQQAGLEPETRDAPQFHIDELRRWVAFVPRFGRSNRALTMQTHSLLARLLTVHPPVQQEDCIRDAAFHAALALEQCLQTFGNEHENTRHFAASLLAAAPDAPTFNIDGIVVLRSDIDDMANERGNHALAANLNLIAAEGWQANVHLAGFVLRGSAILARLREHSAPPATPATLEQVTQEVRSLIDQRHTGDDARMMHAGLNQTLAQTRPVDEGDLHTTAPETLQLLHRYIGARQGPLQSDLQTAFLQRLRDIGNDDGVCNIGCVQRLLDTPTGIDATLMAREPDAATIHDEITSIAGKINNAFENEYKTDYAAHYVNQLAPQLQQSAQSQEHFAADITALKQDMLRATVLDDLVGQRGWNRANVEPQLASVMESMKYL
ncbi:hypothetical protein GCM10022212_06380 [Actimicrobium antarcticum]|uniref:Uncharacterized protein n=1 Tax=Actimicrobium antarcticum TaxID=1051899 RepID=A0ABP7SPG7_9BURK